MFGPCCTGGDCCGPGSYCCANTGPHTHDDLAPYYMELRDTASNAPNGEEAVRSGQTGPEGGSP